MKKNNLWRIIWIIGIYAILTTILYLVITYKVKWESKDLNTYLYFYNCSNKLCTTSNEPKDYYTKILCDNDICPYITEMLKDSQVILSNNNEKWIYDYNADKIINNTYKDYKSLNDYIIVTSKDNLQGIIDKDNNIIINPTYKEIINYQNGYLTYKENNLYGITNKEKNINIEPAYEDIIYINDVLFGYKLDNSYYIAEYATNQSVNNIPYNYLFAYKNNILTINNKEINILDNKLETKLLMKINTYYSYNREGERKSLNIKTDDNYIYFTVFVDEEKYTNYKYDYKNNKLIS